MKENKFLEKFFFKRIPKKLEDREDLLVLKLFSLCNIIKIKEVYKFKIIKPLNKRVLVVEKSFKFLENFQQELEIYKEQIKTFNLREDFSFKAKEFLKDLFKKEFFKSLKKNRKYKDFIKKLDSLLVNFIFYCKKKSYIKFKSEDLKYN